MRASFLRRRRRLESFAHPGSTETASMVTPASASRARSGPDGTLRVRHSISFSSTVTTLTGSGLFLTTVQPFEKMFLSPVTT
jgi:hypothetical protein